MQQRTFSLSLSLLVSFAGAEPCAPVGTQGFFTLGMTASDNRPTYYAKAGVNYTAGTFVPLADAPVKGFAVDIVRNLAHMLGVKPQVCL